MISTLILIKTFNVDHLVIFEYPTHPKCQKVFLLTLSKLVIQNKLSMTYYMTKTDTLDHKGVGPRVVASTAAFHARVRGSVPGLGGLKETKTVSSPSTCESQYCGEPP